MPTPNTSGMRHLRCAANSTVPSPSGFVIVAILAIESTSLKGKAIEGDDFFLATDYATGTGVSLYAGQIVEGMWSEVKTGAGVCYAYLSKID
jgi:hypothetical protein